MLHMFCQTVPEVYKYGPENIYRELLMAQQQTIASFIESIEKEISANSELSQSLLEQASSAASRSL